MKRIGCAVNQTPGRPSRARTFSSPQSVGEVNHGIVNKRRRFTYAILLVAVIALAVGFTLRAREPRYQGKKLSQWLRQLESAPGIESAAWQEAVHAVRQMGTNALPTLLNTLQASDPKWKVEAVDWVRQVLNRDLSDRLVAGDWPRSLMGLHALGPAAGPAIPTLAAMITNANPDLADMAFLGLSQIGVAECVPALVHTLTNGNVILRPAAAVSLGSLRGHARDAVPALAASLTDRDANVRIEAARALGFISQNPGVAVPALTRALSDTNAQVSRTAAVALGGFGTEAEPALPALRALPVALEEFPRRGIARAIVRVQCEMRDGGIIRGPKNEQHLALVFTGHEFAEGGETILDALKVHQGKGSFFLTGDFLRNAQFTSLRHRMTEAGHYVGPHSDKHLLYCAWDDSRNTLVTEEEFTLDLFANLRLIPNATWSVRRASRYFLPPFEHYNSEIADWTRKHRWNLINFTPGTRANADYTGEADQNFVSSQAIFDSILQREREDPHGLNGYLLLLHLGSGPGRADKFHPRFGELLDTLAAKGYRFVGVDELLEPKREETRDEYSLPFSR
jgi:peptidoglycan/xylan/chitin deacetylase (PgdA/CDA1 family)